MYIHRDALGRVFYVGKGSGRRAWQVKNRSSVWTELRANSHSVEIIEAELSESDAYRKEIEMIFFYRKDNFLANATDGGKGPGEAARRRLSEQKKGIAFWPKGKKRPKEFADMVSKRMAGVKKSKIHAESCRKAMLGKRHSLETIKIMKEKRSRGTHNSKPIVACGWYIQSMTAFANFIGRTPLCVKKWVDQGKQDRIDREFRGAFRAA